MDNSIKRNAEIIKQRWPFEAEQQALLATDPNTPFSKTWLDFMGGVGLSKFVTAAKLAEFLTEMEEKSGTGFDAQSDVSDAYISTFLNAEYILVRAYGEFDELQYNPYLLHWADAVSRCQPLVTASVEACREANVPRWIQALLQARLEIIKCALGLAKRNLIDGMSPMKLIALGRDKYTAIREDELVTLLKSQGLYTETSEPSPHNEHHKKLSTSLESDGEIIISRDQTNNGNSTVDGHYTMTTANADQEVQDVQEHLDEAKVTNQLSASDQQLSEFDDYFIQQPWDAIHELVRLPPDIASLDLITRVLTDDVMRQGLKLYQIKLDDLVREHLQHSLLYLEQLSTSNNLTDSIDISGSKADIERMATLLTIYLRNILPRGIVSVDMIYLDLSELCTRYIWVAAVREFKTWFENAVGASSVVDGEDSAESSQAGLAIGG